MKPRGWALVVILVVAAGVGGYALHGGFGHSAGSGGGGAATSGFGGRGGAPGGFSRGGGPAGGASVPNAEITVQMIGVKSGPLVAQRTATGTVVPVTQSDVAAQASGTVDTLLVNVGDDVKAGQPIVQLNTASLELALANAHTQLGTAQINLQTQQTNTQQATTQLQSQVDSAQAALAAAQASYDSAQKVYALGGTSKASVDSARSQLAQAQANVTSAQNALSQNQRAESESLQQLKLAVTQADNGVKQAELNLASATIRAPFAGQVASFAVAPGEYVGPSTTVATLVSTQRQVQLAVPPTDAAAFPAGTKLVFATSVAQYPVTVTQRPGAPVNQSVTVYAGFDGGGSGGDVPAVGSVGTVTYQVTLATATLVPISAIQNDGTNTFVFVVQNGKAVQTNLTLLAQAGNYAAVSGVPSGVTIVDQPPPGLLNGSSVVSASAAGGKSAPGGAAGRGAAGGGVAGGPGAGGAASGRPTPPAGASATPARAGNGSQGTSQAGSTAGPRGGSTSSGPAAATGSGGTPAVKASPGGGGQ